ncbi:MAG: Rrf2 family transcriptional regulator [Treponema sp.]|jgi:Rrf2 family iron-sulfur cluster assembly transcriptional regulator|nr:Rrf2 family transcriptional regulator [Treponema sp.]
MRITTRGRYALRASLVLARLSKNGGPVSISVLADAENISCVFLEQIFFKLRKGGIVASVRGPGGGFYFTRPVERITVREILEAAGEEIDLNTCDKSLGTCDRIDSCLSHQVWVDVVNMVNRYLESLTLAAILERGCVLEEIHAAS